MKANNHTVSSENPISRLAKKYPQLLLPIRAGEKETEEYRAAVLSGALLSAEPDFIGSPGDSLSVAETPAGKAEILYLENREDFEHAFRALAHRCEPVEIPASVGATTIRGLINWEKIHNHEKEYLQSGENDWDLEFRRFTAEKANYLDSLILLSSGDYSNVSAETAGLPAEEWKEKSVTIRKYHELTHFICRALYPDDVDAVRDEVIADLIGLVAAFGDYDVHLAETFLGIEGERFREGGRLSYYTDAEHLSETVSLARRMIHQYAEAISAESKSDPFRLIPILMGIPSR